MTTEKPASEVAHTLSIDRVLDAPLDKVWRCWTEPNLLKQWFCPKPWYVSEARMDPRSGGEFFTVMNGPNGERFDNPGLFLAIEPKKRLVFTDSLKPDWLPTSRPFMVAEVIFEDLGNGKTRYAGYARHWNEETMREHEAMGFHDGWNKAADQLEEVARSL